MGILYRLFPSLNPDNWPQEPGEWHTAGARFGQLLREASAEVATEIGADDLALEIREGGNTTPGSKHYIESLNHYRGGAGNRAYRLAMRRQRREIRAERRARRRMPTQ